MSKYTKIIKWLMWALLIVSVVVSVYGFIVGFEQNDGTPVDTLLYWAYVMVAGAVFSAVVIGIVIGAINNPKSLLKLGLGLVCVAAVVGAAYLLASGAPAVGIVGEQPSTGTLKFTDTILNLTYLACGAAIVSVVAGVIVKAIRK